MTEEEKTKSTLLNSVNIPKYMEKYVSLLDSLKELTEDNLEETLAKVRHNYFQEDYDEVASNLIYSTKESICEEELACKITYKLCVAWKLFNYSVLRVFGSMDDLLPFTKTIRILYNYGIWTFEEVQGSLKEIKGFLLIFAKEINDFCPQNDEFDQIVSEYRKNNWYLYDDIMKNGFESNSPGYAIKNDDVELLRDITTNNDYDFNQMIGGEFFETNKKSLITTAAYYGSINCFKFLILNKAKIDAATAEASIYGGNHEIIRLCQDEKVDCSSFISASIISHRDDLFEWANESCDCKQPSLYECASSINYRALLYYVGKTGLSKDKEPAICIAAKMGLYSICRALIENGDKMTGTMGFGYTALHLAVKFEHFYVVTLLCSSGAEINKLTDEHLSAYDFAEKQKYDEISSYLAYNNAKPSRQLRIKK